jgi:hypothetical protein
MSNEQAVINKAFEERRLLESIIALNAASCLCADMDRQKNYLRAKNSLLKIKNNLRKENEPDQERPLHDPAQN